MDIPDDPLFSFRILEALRTNNLPSLDSLLSSSPSPTALSPLHLAVQVSSPETVLHLLSRPEVNVNGKSSKGDTPLHVAAKAGRPDIVELLLKDPRTNDGERNFDKQRPDEVAKTSAIATMITYNRDNYFASRTVLMHQYAHAGDFSALKALFADPRTAALIDINHQDPIGGLTVLHEAARRGQLDVVKWLLDKGADVFIRDRRGKLAIEGTKDDKVKAMIKQFTKAAEPSALTTYTTPGEAPKMQGFLHKWTNFATGFKTRWFVLDRGVLSYYRAPEDTDNACRGSVSLRIAKLWVDSSDSLRFDIIGKGSVRYHLRADHAVEAKRWVLALTQSKQWLNENAEKNYPPSSKQAARKGRAATDSSAGSSVHTVNEDSGSEWVLPTSRESRESSGHLRSPSGNSFISTVVPGVPIESIEELTIEGAGGSESARGRARHFQDESYSSERSRSPSPDINNKPPHATAYPTAVSSLNAQLELQTRLLTSLTAEAAPSPTTSKPETTSKRSELARATLQSMSALQSMVAKTCRMAEEREAYWKRMYESESEKQVLWAESLRELALEKHRMEEQVKREDKASPSTSKRHRTKSGRSLTTGTVPSGSAGGTDDEPAAGGQAGVESSIPIEVDSEDDESSDAFDGDAEEEFFDALDDGVTTASGNEKSETANSPCSSATTSAVYALPGYPTGDAVRNWLPLPESNSAPEMSLWGVIKNSIGKDLSKITLPVFFNEPLSMLQRMGEDMEYAELLDKAASHAGSTERILYVAAFAMSNYSSTVGRTGKPFNPLLGETYELSLPEKGYRYVSEQVSHHPPISACHCESSNYEFFAEVYVKSQFWGKSLEIMPMGTSHVRLKIPNSWRTGEEGSRGGEDPGTKKKKEEGEPQYLEHYSYKKVTTCVNNLIYGKLWVDHYGEMVIRNHGNGETAVLNFKQRGWRDKHPGELKGEVKDRNGNTVWEMSGRWDDKLIARRPNGGTGSKPVLLWRRNTMPESTPFKLTTFAMSLNDAPESITRYLCPTDCRFRPDQHAMERGEWSRADTEKNRLEVKQRAKRKEGGERSEEPKWFQRERDEDTGEEYWKFRNEYWDRRDRMVQGKGTKEEIWPDVADLY